MSFRTAFPEGEIATTVVGEPIGAPTATIERILGDRDTFLERHWQKRFRFSPEAAPDYVGCYGVESFLLDLAAVHKPPYVAVSCEGPSRIFSEHPTLDSLRAGIGRGEVAAIKASRFWHGEMPASWLGFRDLYAALCRNLVMTYLTPARSEDVDLFLAGGSSSLGAHFDTTDVFTVQLHGERRWIIEEEVDLDRIMTLVSGEDWYPAKTIGFGRPTKEIVLRAGDALYVPAYSVHEVTGVSWSVSLSLGLRAFSAFDLADHLFDRLRRTALGRYRPARTAPDATGEKAIAAKLALLRQLREVLQDIEANAVGFLMGPSLLPRDFDPSCPDGVDIIPAAGRDEGFALHRPSNS